MYPARIDVRTTAFAGRRTSRRRALKGTVAGLGAAGLRRAEAQDSTPASEEILTDDAFLFVQTAASGSLVPNPLAGTSEVDGTPTPSGGVDYLLTLAGHPGGTVYFSDRPARIFGEAPTEAFLAGLGFGAANPPNAALVAQTESGDEVVVLELLDPAYDAGSGTLTYGANLLAKYEGAGLAHVADQETADELPETFGRASLFIDDCPDITSCDSCSLQPDGDHACVTFHPLPGGPRGRCWSWSDFSCQPCQDYGDLNGLCNQTYGDCKGNCEAR